MISFKNPERYTSTAEYNIIAITIITAIINIILKYFLLITIHLLLIA